MARQKNNISSLQVLKSAIRITGCQIMINQIGYLKFDDILMEPEQLLSLEYMAVPKLK